MAPLIQMSPEQNQAAALLTSSAQSALPATPEGVPTTAVPVSAAPSPTAAPPLGTMTPAQALPSSDDSGAMPGTDSSLEPLTFGEKLVQQTQKIGLAPGRAGWAKTLVGAAVNALGRGGAALGDAANAQEKVTPGASGALTGLTRTLDARQQRLAQQAAAKAQALKDADEHQRALDAHLNAMDEHQKNEYNNSVAAIQKRQQLIFAHQYGQVQPTIAADSALAQTLKNAGYQVVGEGLTNKDIQAGLKNKTLNSGQMVALATGQKPNAADPNGEPETTYIALNLTPPPGTSGEITLSKDTPEFDLINEYGGLPKPLMDGQELTPSQLYTSHQTALRNETATMVRNQQLVDAGLVTQKQADAAPMVTPSADLQNALSHNSDPVSAYNAGAARIAKDPVFAQRVGGIQGWQQQFATMYSAPKDGKISSYWPEIYEGFVKDQTAKGQAETLKAQSDAATAAANASYAEPNAKNDYLKKMADANEAVVKAQNAQTDENLSQEEKRANIAKAQTDRAKAQFDLDSSRRDEAQLSKPDDTGFISPLSEKEYDKRYDAFSKSKQYTTLQTLQGSVQQFDDITGQMQTGNFTGADSVVGLFDAIGISVTPLAGKGMRINKDVINEHIDARGLDQSAYQKLLSLKSGDVITPQQLKDYTSIANAAAYHGYVNAAAEAHRQGLPVDFLPQGGGKQIDQTTASIYMGVIAQQNPALAQDKAKLTAAAQAAAKANGWN